MTEKPFQFSASRLNSQGSTEKTGGDKVWECKSEASEVGQPRSRPHVCLIKNTACFSGMCVPTERKSASPETDPQQKKRCVCLKKRGGGNWSSKPPPKKTHLLHREGHAYPVLLQQHLRPPVRVCRASVSHQPSEASTSGHQPTPPPPPPTDRLTGCV